MTIRGEIRKLALQKAAREVFEEKGFFDTRIADIVARAGIAQGTFYTYFDSKEAIFTSISKEVVAEMLIALLPPEPVKGSPYDRARHAMDRFVTAYRPNARWLALQEQLGSTTAYLQHLRLQVREAFVDRMARGIENQQRSGDADPDVDPLIMAEVLGSMVDHVCYIWMNLGKDFDQSQLVDHLALVYARALGFPNSERVQADGKLAAKSRKRRSS